MTDSNSEKSNAMLSQYKQHDLRRSSRETSDSMKSTSAQDTRTIKTGQRFMGNFDPETSARERRKLSRKLNNTSRRYVNAVYDERGVHIKTGKDLCDCLKEKCTGCFYPCPKCRSKKCGTECRNLRKYIYDIIEYEGSDYKVKNPLAVAQK